MESLRIDILPENARNQLKDFYEFLVKNIRLIKKCHINTQKGNSGLKKELLTIWPMILMRHWRILKIIWNNSLN